MDKMWILIVMTGLVANLQDTTCEPCTGFLTEPTGVITAPDMNNDSWYDNNANCLWIIEVHESKSIHIKFLEMDIEEELVCEYDRIKVRDGLTPKVFHCGTTLPPDFISDTRLAIFEFKSDSSIRRKGFKAVYSLIEDPTCGYRTWRNSGHFGSFDTTLKPGLCTWAIQGPRQYIALHVFIYKMSLTPSTNCEDEYVEVYDDIEVFGRYCEPSDHPVITTTENVLYVDLMSTAVNQKEFEFHAFYAMTENFTAGFKLVSAVPDKTELFIPVKDIERICGDITTQPAGFISSADRNGDGLYDNGQNCVWTFVAPSLEVLRLEFMEFDLESDKNCGFDYVHTAYYCKWVREVCQSWNKISLIQVFDGPFEYGAEIGKYCGDVLPPVIWTTGNILVVQFYADIYNPDDERGFNATYQHFTVSEKEAMLHSTTEDAGKHPHIITVGLGSSTVTGASDSEWIFP